MPICKNDPLRHYTGNEPSPKGLGYCAHAIAIGRKKKGLDGNMWIVKLANNGSKRWVKIPPSNKKIRKPSGSKTAKKIKTSSIKTKKSPGSKKTIPKFLLKKKTVRPPIILTEKRIRQRELFWKNLEKMYGMKHIKKLDWDKWLSNLSKSNIALINKILTKIKPELESKGINFMVVPLPRANGYFWIDYVWDYARRALKEYVDIPTSIIMMVIRLDNDNLYHQEDMLVDFQHSLTKKESEIVYDIFYKHLKNNFRWNKSPNRTIIVTPTNK